MKQRIRIGIRYRLFIAFLTAACCLVIGMFLTTWVSFERGVLRLVHQEEKERLASLARILESAYGDVGTWGFLNYPGTSWMKMVASSRPAPPPRNPEHQPPTEPPIDHAFPPDRLPPPPLPKGRQLFELRVILTDDKGQVLHGARAPWPDPPFFIELKNHQQIIGRLGLIPPRILSDQRVQRFASEQNRSLFIISLGVIAVAGLLSIPLASRLVRRITALAAATAKLAAGRYEIRVPVETSDELGQLARDFNSLAASLEKNQTLRRRWVADISHELRTPLAVLRGEVEAVQDGVRSLSRETVDRLHAEILHLSRLVDDLYELSLADIGALTYRKAQVDLGLVIAQAVQSYEKEFTKCGISLEFQSDSKPMLLIGDGERLRQMLNNLLQNSLRYTDSGGKLIISCTAQGQEICLDFSDSPPGVPSESLPHLFERLYRVEDSRNRALGGAGLGLALCASIVEAHGGTISAAPSPLGGLAITITLPTNG